MTAGSAAPRAPGPLPIDPLLPDLSGALAAHRGVVLQAPPGAGKTTRVPLALAGADWLGGQRIVMLEPRRVAARAAARYMARSLGEAVGATVGYRVRLDSRVGPRTRIEVVTEGVLTRMLQDDPALEGVGLVVFDEFHERSLQADLGLALCLDSQGALREDLRILVMSATLEGEAVAALLGDAPVLRSTGRGYPVAVRHVPVRASHARERPAFLREVALAVTRALGEEAGGVLVFLPGVGEIRQVQAMLAETDLGAGVAVTPLHGQLDGAAQDAAIAPAPPGMRKLVLATAIAETSLTLDGIRIVVDAGLQRLPRFDPTTGLTRLATAAVSRAAADQRCGRAGRQAPGVCYRLWPEHRHLQARTPPEIVDADLAPLVLELARWGVRRFDALRWLDAPPDAHLDQARALLADLGALDGAGCITAHGKAMAALNAHPRLAHMMLRGRSLGCAGLACELAALLEERDPLRGDAAGEADLGLRVAALREKTGGRDADRGAIARIRAAAGRWRGRLGTDPASAGAAEPAMIGTLLAFAYPDRIARRREGPGGRFLLSSGRGALLDESDPLGVAEYLVAAHLEGGREARIRLAAPIHIEQLLSHHAERLTERRFVDWDEREGCVRARRQRRLGELVLEDRPWDDADAGAVQAAMLDGVRRAGLACLPWTPAARGLQARLGFAHRLAPDAWPDVSDETLAQTLETWLAPHLAGATRLAHLKRVDLHEALLAPLVWRARRELDSLAPTHLTVPSGSRIPLEYGHETPVLAVRLQELFGLTETPRIAGGRVPVLLHLLSPARRPVQVTQDLAAFWQGAYREVKKELKGRYPKHHWPDDPLSAPPTARAKRRGGG